MRGIAAGVGGHDVYLTCYEKHRVGFQSQKPHLDSRKRQAKRAQLGIRAAVRFHEDASSLQEKYAESCSGSRRSFFRFSASP